MSSDTFGSNNRAAKLSLATIKKENPKAKLATKVLAFAKGSVGLVPLSWKYTVIGYVKPNSQAAARGVKVGWEITEINKQTVTPDNVFSFLDTPEGFEVTFTYPGDLKSEGKELEGRLNDAIRNRDYLAAREFKKRIVTLHQHDNENQRANM